MPLHTVHNDSVMITSAIDAYERRDMMTIDWPGAFLRTMVSDPVFMKLQGPLVETLLLIDPAMCRDCKESIRKNVTTTARPQDSYGSYDLHIPKIRYPSGRFDQIIHMIYSSLI